MQGRWGQQTFSVQGKRVNILGFASYPVSMEAAHLGKSSAEWP